MADPVSRAGGVRMNYNEALERGAERTYLEKVPVKGPSVADIERVQRGRPSVAKGVAQKAALEVVAHAGLHHLKEHGKAAGARLGATIGLKVMSGFMAKALISAATGDPARSEGDKAVIREHYSQATALLARGALPADYVSARVTDEAQARGRLTEAVESMRVKLGSMEKADALMTEFARQAERSAFEGMQYGAAYELRSRGDLDALLAREKPLAERCQVDLAFREGLEAMVWLATNRPADFEARRGLMVSQQSAVSRAR